TNSTEVQASNLCSYPSAGNYTAKVQVERGGQTATASTQISATGAPLTASLSASPSVGVAPRNNVSLQAAVSGSATGEIIYRFDCTSNGTWNWTTATNSTEVQASNLCSYTNAGTYTATVEVERGGQTAQQTTQITATQTAAEAESVSANNQAQTTNTVPEVSLSASPSSGVVPLNNVSLLASVFGPSTGEIIYRFDCTSNGTWNWTTATNSTEVQASNLCSYPSAGNYTAKVQVERGGQTATAITQISVTSTALDVSLSASPASGAAPLSNVSLAAAVSGSATGEIIYRFDCTSNGTWNWTTATNSTEVQASDLCTYENTGTHTATVEVERGGHKATASTAIVVSGDVTVALFAAPSSGTAPLNNVSLHAQVSGSPQGEIIYRFACTTNNVWNWTTATNSMEVQASNLCSYDTAGTYVATVEIEIGEFKTIAVTPIEVSAPGPITAGKLAQEEARSDLALDISVNPSIALPGSRVTHTITVRNQGEAAIEEVLVSYLLPKGFSSDDKQTLTWTIPVLSAGQEFKETFSALIATDIADGRHYGMLTASAKNHPFVHTTQSVLVARGETVQMLPQTGVSGKDLMLWSISLLGLLGSLGFFVRKKLDFLKGTRFLLLLAFTLGFGGLLVYPAVPQLSYSLGLIGDQAAAEQQPGSPGEYPENALIIPKIGVRIPIIDGDTESALEKGAWRLPRTSMPDQGGNTVLSAHRFQYGLSNEKTFYLLDKLEYGDSFYVFWNGKRYDYQVQDREIVSPYALEVLESTEHPMVTLLTCNPIFSDAQRLIVRAHLISVS
ncbi:MAG: sortase, partial [Candidatus Yanofskybacteria bacterium]|nr:sortase [Candidatus Yanofskybacteria bacterium]